MFYIYFFLSSVVFFAIVRLRTCVLSTTALGYFNHDLNYVFGSKNDVRRAKSYGLVKENITSCRCCIFKDLNGEILWLLDIKHGEQKFSGYIPMLMAIAAMAWFGDRPNMYFVIRTNILSAVCEIRFAFMNYYYLPDLHLE